MSSTEAGEVSVAAAGAGHSKARKGKGKQHVPAPVRPVLKKPPKQLPFYEQYQTELAVAGFALVMLILIYMMMTS
jgi:hypothetical protein